MSEENIAIRLKFLIENLGLTSSQFADKCDIARPTLSQLLSGRNKKISNLIIEQIHSSYPTLSVLWLLFGEGDMWTTNLSGNNSVPENLGKNDTNEVPDSNIINDSYQGRTETSTSSPAKTTLNTSKNPCENRESLDEGKDGINYPKENGVNANEITSANTNNENVNRCYCNSEFISQIGKLKEKSRKVVQITVYYDDSTFQTFYPNK